MHRWEYATLQIEAGGFFRTGKVDTGTLGAALNKAGAEGWEVCGVFDTNFYQGGTREVIVLMKRPIDDSAAARRE